MSDRSKSDQNDNDQKGSNNEDNHHFSQNLKNDASASTSTISTASLYDIWKDEKRINVKKENDSNFTMCQKRARR